MLRSPGTERLSGASHSTGTAHGAVRLAAIVVAIAIVCALILALPGQTVITRYPDDLFGLLDGAYRVGAGQVPGRDFHTPLGPLASYIPAAGHWLSGSLGAALPVGMALLIAAFAPAAGYVLGSRLHPFLAVSFGAFVILVLAAPINLGESVTALSFAMFYNRIGWAALAVLLVMYLRPRQAWPGQEGLDAAAAAFLTLVMVYTKITYGLVALAFLAFLLLDRRQRRWAASAILATLVAGLLVEAVWRSSLAHLADLLLTAQVSGSPRGTTGQIIDHLLGNLADYVLFALFAGLALARSRSIRDAAFYLFCAVTGFAIINQNLQAWGILTLHAAAVVAAETILRTAPETAESGSEEGWLSAGAKLLLLALVLPTTVHCALALGLHATVAGLRAGEPVPLPNLKEVRLANLWTWGDHEGGLKQFERIRSGAAALRALEPPASRVVVLDRANPFSAGLGLEPSRGDSAWLRWGRTLDATHFIPPGEFLAGAQVVMEPRPPEPAGGGEPVSDGEHLRALYGPALAGAFTKAGENEHWILHLRREPPARTSCAGCGGP